MAKATVMGIGWSCTDRLLPEASVLCTLLSSFNILTLALFSACWIILAVAAALACMTVWAGVGSVAVDAALACMTVWAGVGSVAVDAAFACYV